MSRGKPRTPRVRLEGEYTIDTGTARVVRDPQRDGAYVLEVNNVPSSPIVPGSPRILGFDYMVWAAGIVGAVVEKHLDPATVHLTHLGGAACTLPRYFADLWPHSTNTVVELDGKLAEYVRAWFDFPDPPRVELLVDEARNATHRLLNGSTDVLIRDVFAGGSTPAHLETVEFVAAAARTLSPGGLYLANHAAFPGLQTTRRELAGMLEVFDYVAAVSEPEVLAGRKYGNIALLGAHAPLDEAAITARLDGAVLRSTSWAVETAAGASPRRD